MSANANTGRQYTTPDLIRIALAQWEYLGVDEDASDEEERAAAANMADVLRIALKELTPTPALEWTPFPGHWPGQGKEDIFYGFAEYMGLHLEIFEFEPGSFNWSFYDDASYDPDLAVAINDRTFRDFDLAVDDLIDYCDGYIAEQQGV